jgi:hypothetical protein
MRRLDHRSQANFVVLEEREIEGFIPLGRDGTLPNRDWSEKHASPRMRSKRKADLAEQRLALPGADP